MGKLEPRADGGAGVLRGYAVRTPLPDEDAERMFHGNMQTIAEGRERKAELLADPAVSVADAYEEEVQRVAKTFEGRLRHLAGENYESVAREYLRGERNDRVGRLTAYYTEGLWRIQQRSTISEMLFFPLILRYPDSFTVNLRFTDDYTTTESIPFESPEHTTVDAEETYSQQYFNESQYEQKQAAEYLRQTAQIIRDEFPSPDEAPVSERNYGGIVSAGGRHESEFSEMLARVTPDPNRFSEAVTEPTLVREGSEAKRTARRYLQSAKVEM